jgi:hypothetical protein
VKARPNDKCPCGSGAKYKKCCGAPGVRASLFTPADRVSALHKLEALAQETLSKESYRALYDEFFGEFPPHEYNDDFAVETTMFAFQLWTFFDMADDEGDVLGELAMEERGLLTHGERQFVKAGIDVRMRLYEVVLSVPGKSVTLRDMLGDTVVEVRELTASKTLKQWDVIATRVFPVGSSGLPEMDGGLLAFPRHKREELLQTLRAMVEGADPDELDAIVREDFPPYFIEAWRAPMPLPMLANQDGHELVSTRVFYDVRTPERVESLLDGASFLAREDGTKRWRWAGPSARQDDVLRGSVALKGSRLVLETNSRERAEEGRALVEGVLGDVVTYRVTETSDMRSVIEREVADKKRHPAEAVPPPGIPPHLMAQVGPQIEAMMKQHYARWVDEPVPMLDGKTPRQAAAGKLRPRVVEALKDLENQYARAKADGQPGFDPTDLWTELGLERPRT